MGSHGMSDTEERSWGYRWNFARLNVIRGARKKGIDLSRIMIVPNGDSGPYDTMPWETRREAVKRISNERRRGHEQSGVRFTD